MFRLRQSFVGKSISWLQNNVRVVGLIYAFREAYQSSRTSDLHERQPDSKVPGLEPGVDNEVFRDLVRDDWSNAWRVTEGLILKMRDEVRAREAKFLVVTGSMGIQVYPDTGARQEYMERVGIHSLFSPDFRIKALGEKEGFKVLNLAPLLQDYADRHNAILHGAGNPRGLGHWNELGHQVAGELIAREICTSSFEEK